MNIQNPWNDESITPDLYPPKMVKEELIELALNDAVPRNRIDKQYVLNVGCKTAGRMAHERGAIVTGIDSSPELVAEAQKYIPAQVGDVFSLPFDKQSFDVALSIMVMMLNKNLQAQLSELQRVLRPEGLLVVGLVHPFADCWDPVTKRSYSDTSNYHLVGERRRWIFHLTDGTVHETTHVHFPLMHLVDRFVKAGFRLLYTYERALPEKYYITEHAGKYARVEYLFCLLQKTKTKGL